MGRPKIWANVTKSCLICGKCFVRTEEQERKSIGKYCSAICHFNSQKLFVDETFFSKPSHEMAYVLGLAITDGCIVERINHPKFPRRTDILTIKSIDKDVLEKTKLLMKSEYSIIRCNLTSVGNQVWRLDTPNQKIVDDVKQWGIVPRKTFITEFPKKLPSEYHVDFIRGVFDGDGNVHHSIGKQNAKKVSVAIAGTKALLEPIPDVLGIECHLVPHVNIHMLKIWKQPELIKFHKAIYYQQGLPWMDRKKKTFDEVISIISNSSKRSQYGFKKREIIHQLLIDIIN